MGKVRRQISDSLVTLDTKGTPTASCVGRCFADLRMTGKTVRQKFARCFDAAAA